MRLTIEGTDLPGRTCLTKSGSYAEVRIGVQRGRQAEQLVAANGARVSWHVELTGVADDVRGPHVQGRRGARFVYLVWEGAGPDGHSGMFRRLKIPLDPAASPLREALLAAGTCTVSMALTGADGTPRCGGLKAHELSWRGAEMLER